MTCVSLSCRITQAHLSLQSQAETGLWSLFVDNGSVWLSRATWFHNPLRTETPELVSGAGFSRSFNISGFYPGNVCDSSGLLDATGATEFPLQFIISFISFCLFVLVLIWNHRVLDPVLLCHVPAVTLAAITSESQTRRWKTTHSH